MTRADKHLAAVILLLAVLAAAVTWQRFFTPARKSSSALAMIRTQGETARQVDLANSAKPLVFVVSGRLGPSTVEVAGGRIRMLEAPCPEQICVRQGWIEHPGESIVCVPGEIVIQIEGAAKLDAVTR